MQSRAHQVYQKIIDACPNFEMKGKNNLYTSDNGYMFSQVNKTGEIGLRLSKEDGLAFVEKYNASPFLSYGATMRGYVAIPEILFDDIALLSTYFNKGHNYVLSLPRK